MRSPRFMVDPDWRSTVKSGRPSVPREWRTRREGEGHAAAPGFSTEAVHTAARVNVTWVTPLGEEVASTS
jgi:hypothetical protein